MTRERGKTANPVEVANRSELPDRTPVAAAVEGIALVVIRELQRARPMIDLEPV